MFRNDLVGFLHSAFMPVILLSLLVFLHPLMASGQVEKGICDGATVVPLNTTLRNQGDLATASHFFKLEIPLPGLLNLDVAVPGFAEVEAKIGLLGRGCGDLHVFTDDSTLIEQTPTRLVLLAETPTTYVLRVAAQDPRRPLGRYKLTTRFVPAEILDRPMGSQLVDKGGESDDEIELEPNGLTLGTELFSPESEQCRSGEVDDHGDTFTCATPLRLGTKVVGEIRNRWGDDGDLFFFTLSEPRTVHLTTTGPTDTFGGLYDRSGHRLAVDDDGGRENHFRIVKTLSSGLYFVRLEGSHSAEGPYTLIFEAPWW